MPSLVPGGEAAANIDRTVAQSLHGLQWMRQGLLKKRAKTFGEAYDEAAKKQKPAQAGPGTPGPRPLDSPDEFIKASQDEPDTKARDTTGTYKGKWGTQQPGDYGTWTAGPPGSGGPTNTPSSADFANDYGNSVPATAFGHTFGSPAHFDILSNRMRNYFDNKPDDIDWGTVGRSRMVGRAMPPDRTQR